MSLLQTLKRHENRRWEEDTALAIQYDGFGNRVEESSGNGVSKFSFDALGQVTKAEYAGGKTATWTYDAARGSPTTSTGSSSVSWRDLVALMEIHP